MFHIGCDDYSNELITMSIPTKTALKWLEVPIEKFIYAVPHFVESLKTHETNINKLIKLQQWEELQKEHEHSLKTVSQLTTLLNDMDTLRSQVVDTEIHKFDKLIFSSKQSALNAIKRYQEIRIRSRLPVVCTQDESTSSSEQQEEKLQIIADLSEDIKHKEKLAVSMDQLQQDVEEIQTLFQDFAELVHEQGEKVEKIEEFVDTTHHNVIEGESMLCQAAKYKTGIYPLMGAVVGTIVGGPVGMLAGFKVGSLTAVSFGFLGFTGGKLLMGHNELTIKEAEHHREELIN